LKNRTASAKSNKLDTGAKLFKEWLLGMPKGKRRNVTLSIPITIPIDKWSHVAKCAIESGMSVADVVSLGLHSGHDIINNEWQELDPSDAADLQPDEQSRTAFTPLETLLSDNVKYRKTGRAGAKQRKS
jgi:hypothetical protein